MARRKDSGAVSRNAALIPEGETAPVPEGNALNEVVSENTLYDPYENILRKMGQFTADMEAASAAGMQVFLLTDCLINRKERDIRVYPNGGFDELREMLSR